MLIWVGVTRAIRISCTIRANERGLSPNATTESTAANSGECLTKSTSRSSIGCKSSRIRDGMFRAPNATAFLPFRLV